MTTAMEDRFIMPLPGLDEPDQLKELVRQAGYCNDQERMLGLLTQIFRRTSYCRIIPDNDFLTLDANVGRFHDTLEYWSQWSRRCYRLYSSGVQRDECQLCNPCD